MPPALSSGVTTNRRATGSARQREACASGHSISTGVANGRRRKSRSPEARADEAPPGSDSLLRRKKRPVTVIGSSLQESPSGSASMLVVRSSVYEDQSDRGRSKAKSKTRTQTMCVDDDVPIVTNIVHDIPRALGPQAKSKRKERSRSRETPSRHSRKTATPELIEEGEEPMYTGPLAQADYHRMKLELDNLRKQVAMSKKTIHKQSKVIDELRSELTSSNESHRNQRAEMERLQIESRKSSDLVAAVEGNLSCQICMDLLLKPYGLSPCGHVLCMNCLLEWFKAAPPGEDDMDDDDYPNALLYRKKTCPCCRAIVRSRPIPLYVVKSLASALDKAKAPEGVSRASPPPNDEDPWAGIFRKHAGYDEYWSTDEEDEDDGDAEDGEEYDEDDADDDDDYWSFDGYGTGEDEVGYVGAYVAPRWSPPTAAVAVDEYPFLDPDSEEFKMLRRGATMAMIELFQMNYSHDTGLTAVVEDGNVVYLGWNIELHTDDETGEEYMDWILGDMYDRPERWRMIHDALDGTWSAHRLVPQDEADEEYDDTDSDVWTADDDDEDM
ncbi:hypothetical protein C8Q79DRAFT_985905 [Trametes meyenii]|nr:hypothetical protein C8Q79DRAFT_985905 [Trametes meyenii]